MYAPFRFLAPRGTRWGLFISRTQSDHRAPKKLAIALRCSITYNVLVKPRKRDEVDEFLPLAPVVFEILLALADGERHGYAIKREVALRTNGKVQLGPGTLYGAIKRMLEQGLIEESDARPDPHLDDERRNYYRLTALGTAVTRAELSRLKAILLAAQSKLLLASHGKD